MKIVWLTLSFLMFLESSCGFYHSKEEGLRPEMSQYLAEPNYTLLREYVFSVKCLNCHQSGGSASNVPLDDYQAMMNADLIVVGDPDQSRLVNAIENGSMPTRRSGLPKVTADELNAIRKWITDGASFE